MRALEAFYTLNCPIYNLFPCPLMQEAIRNIPQQHMNMFQPPYTLQGRIILEPQDHVLCRSPIRFSKPIHKRPLHKVLNQFMTLLRNYTLPALHGDRRPRPNNQMLDPLVKSIRPVITQDLVVCGIRKGNRIVEQKGGGGDGGICRQRPSQPLQTDVVCA